MTYYVYENWTIKKAVIHFANCSYCNYGNGIHEYDSARNGKWHGEFDTLKQAQKAAQETSQPFRPCKKCNP